MIDLRGFLVYNILINKRENIMSGHIYKDCNGARFLTSLSASWFISYSYYLKIDSSHLNWEKCRERIPNFNKSKKYHREWIEKITKMNPLKLNKNQIGINGVRVKEMAKELLNFLENN